ncbi:unnamed protein product [Rotaria sp. Silwood2]|nr:unnamed protein product [Rotaria sp. Silwood2]
MYYLRKNLINNNNNNNQNFSIDFLMPCHSTPYYNFIHQNDIQLNFLTCEPNLDDITNNYIDEADQFF